jgi:hypothetical protein
MAARGDAWVVRDQEESLSALQTRPHSLVATAYFSNQNPRPPLAFNDVGNRYLALRGIFFVADFLRQSAFHHNVGFTPDVFVPGSILAL